MISSMMEKLVSRDVAFLLKEKGFSERVPNHFYNGMITAEYMWDDWNKSRRHSSMSAPSQSLAQKWLREKFRINLYIEGPKPYVGRIYNPWTGKIITVRPDSTTRYKVYEEALDATLKEALQIIE